MNLLVMSLVSAAALSFSSCSSDDDLGGGTGTGQSKVNSFYMTLAVQTPTSNGTRTEQKNEFEATAAESDVTSGTFYLVDANGQKAWSKTISSTEWKSSQIPSQGKEGTTRLEIEVEDVAAGATYKVYFLANTTAEDPWANTGILTTGEKFAKPYDTDNEFAMFNQNDASVNGSGYTVVFEDKNKNSDTPAQIKYQKDDNAEAVPGAPIKIERITARIDQPKVGKNTITNIEEVENISATEAEKKAMKDALEKVESLKLTRYAISNLANKSYIMQNWEEKIPNNILNIPTGITYQQASSDFGTATKLENDKFFIPLEEDGHKDYVFENNSETDATKMYFEYKVTLNDELKAEADFEDGTFYRYNNILYSNFAEILNAYGDVPGLFNGKSADQLVAELTEAKAKPTEDEENPKDIESKLDEFRKAYDIEVFNEGKTYYNTVIEDQYIGYKNAIQRNSVYQLTVNNIFNVGAQVPNGTPDKTALFYLDVTVSVNPWVLNTQDVNLQ